MLLTFTSPKPLDFSTETSHALKQFISFILLHCGFDSSHASALTYLHDLVVSFIKMIGKSVKDDAEDKINGYEALNKVCDVKTISKYIVKDVYKYHSKLYECSKKLDAAYMDYESVCDMGILLRLGY